jgi:hypothetical protein
MCRTNNPVIRAAIPRKRAAGNANSALENPVVDSNA